MSAETKRFTGSDKQLVQARADAILEYPEGPFTHRELDGTKRDVFRDFLRNGIIEPVGEEMLKITEEESPSGTPTWYKAEEYEVVDHAREIAEQVVTARDSIWPCDHAGIRYHNGRYMCGCSICDAEYDEPQMEVRR